MRRLFAPLIAFLLIVVPAAAGDGEWAPDAALIARIEAALPPILENGLTDPGDHPVSAPATLDKYTRLYAGETVKGERVVVGALVLGIVGPPGIKVVSMHGLPNISGGGCGVIMIWYHVATGKIENVCNFPE